MYSFCPFRITPLNTRARATKASCSVSESILTAGVGVAACSESCGRAVFGSVGLNLPPGRYS